MEEVLKGRVGAGSTPGGASADTANAPALTLDGIVKRYGGTTALDEVSFTTGRGSVVALFGENGAGKSTLMTILAGAQAADAGTIELDGARFAPRSPREALTAGIALVAQELSPCRHLSVAENVVVGAWPTHRRLTGRVRVRQRVRELTERVGIDLPLDARLGDLSVGDAQIVEILRVLCRQPRVVLLDEPTAALSASEAELVLGLIRRLAASGVTVLLVTHRVEEALAVADQALVLRGGRLVLDAPRAEVTSDLIVEQMLGRALRPRERDERLAEQDAAPVLELDGWTKAGPEPLHDLSLQVPRGAVVGLYGVRGSGVETVAAGLAGVGRLDAGATRVGETRVKGAFASPRAREAAAVRYVSNDRAETGLALRLSVATNLLFALDEPALSRGIMRRPAAERSAVRDLIDRYRIALSRPSQRIFELSGGNQQKVLMGSRLQGSFEALVVHEPTRGIDLGAREAIHDALRATAQAGRAVLVISTDVDEIVELCPRCVVIRDGRVAATLRGDAVTTENLLYAATAGDEAADGVDGASGAGGVRLKTREGAT